jgi:pyruvate,orthophosphate dikinase
MTPPKKRTSKFLETFHSLPRRAKPHYVSTFGQGMAPAWTDNKVLLGGKGSGLALMSQLGLPVPPGFTITTDACVHFLKTGKFPAGMDQEIDQALKMLERALDRKFGDPEAPLLVSVRSGAQISMPGMMDTVLNLGLNDNTLNGLAEATDNMRFALDSRRRFTAMYGDVVLGITDEHGCPFDAILSEHKAKLGVEVDSDLDEKTLKAVIKDYRALIKKETKKTFPDDPRKQLWGAIRAVFESWNNDRAKVYRSMNQIPDEWGTAVTVQAMVFGNRGEGSGTGVAFTRNPSTGEKDFYGEFLINAQGEDVVAGTRTPLPIAKMKRKMPSVYAQLLEVREVLEERFGDMQDLEFTIEDGKLFLLQTRLGKRTGAAAVRIATDLVLEKKISKEEALLRVDPESITQLLSPVFKGSGKKRAIADGLLLAKGLNAGPGAATGVLAFSADEAVKRAKASKDPVILARVETSPDDIRGMKASVGILTQHGGMTSHAALVARQMGKVCVAGCGQLDIDSRSGCLTSRDGRVLKAGDWISLDGSTGEVIAGKIDTRRSDVLRSMLGSIKPSKDGDDVRFRRIMKWADQVRRMNVRANADQPDQATMAIALGAEGIGLCRTEHMFFGERKLKAMQQMILAKGPAERAKALKVVLPLQRKDFYGILKAMGSRPVTVRTLDPPLHEFLPQDEKGMRGLAEKFKMPLKEIRKRIEQLHESNPMLGFRGCRLTFVVPEILEVQVRALLEAATQLRKEGVKVKPEIMIPLVGTRAELAVHEKLVRAIADDIRKTSKIKVPYLVGTMIEIPRAALTADQIAKNAEFFSFGTNDLTQMTLGMSRDDSSIFLPKYVENRFYDINPFESIDQDGVGTLMEWAVYQGRETRPDLKIGICGEHGGEPRSVEFCHLLGLDYVSCSPFRIPVARLAAAQATVRELLKPNQL